MPGAVVNSLEETQKFTVRLISRTLAMHYFHFDDLLADVRINFQVYQHREGARGGVVVKALRYKPAGRGFNSRWCRWNFSVT
jgi:hypothetical protein